MRSKLVEKPLWHLLLVNYYQANWSGKEHDNDSILALLKTHEEAPDFHKNLQEFKSYINRPDTQHSLPRTEKKHLFFDSYFVSYTKEYKQLNEILDTLILKHDPKALAIQSLSTLLALALNNIQTFIYDHPFKAITLLVLMIFMTQVDAVDSKSTQKLCEIDSDDPCSVGPQSLSLIPFKKQPFSPRFDAPYSTGFSPFKEGIKNLQILQEKSKRKFDDLSGQNRKHIERALSEVSNLRTIQLMLENEVSIVVVSESLMKKVTGIADFSGCFIPTPYNQIFLNEHIFKGWDEHAKKQLTTMLANEISHACVHNTLPEPLRINKKDPSMALLPWISEDEKKIYLDAYNQFENRIAQFEWLDQKREFLTCPLATILAKYDKAMMAYIPPAYGELRYNSMQAKLTRVGDTLILDKNPGNTEPSSTDLEKKLDYLRQVFFQELKNKKIEQNLLHSHNMGIYSRERANHQIIANNLSDFETLSPEMREAFGPELCQYLSTYHESENYCERLCWPQLV
jgi:hypothetical protein